VAAVGLGHVGRVGRALGVVLDPLDGAAGDGRQRCRLDLLGGVAGEEGLGDAVLADVTTRAGVEGAARRAAASVAAGRAGGGVGGGGGGGGRRGRGGAALGGVGGAVQQGGPEGAAHQRRADETGADQGFAKRVHPVAFRSWPEPFGPTPRASGWRIRVASALAQSWLGPAGRQGASSSSSRNALAIAASGSASGPAKAGSKFSSTNSSSRPAAR